MINPSGHQRKMKMSGSKQKTIEREHSSVSTEELFSLITRQALEFILTKYLTTFFTLRKECSPEIDHLFLIRLTSSSPLKIRASRKYKFVAYKSLFP